MSIEVLADQWAIEQDLLLGCALLEKVYLNEKEYNFLKKLNMLEDSIINDSFYTDEPDFEKRTLIIQWLNLKVYSEASHGENQLKREQGL